MAFKWRWFLRPARHTNESGGAGAAVVREARRFEDDRGWRVAAPGGRTVAAPERDLTNWEHLLQEAYDYYTTNPLAYAVIEQGTNFVLGGGARVVAEDSRTQRVIDAFWHDPENRMPLRVYSIQTELSLFGEQFLRLFTDSLTGRVVVRQLDPLYVKAIETDPEDLERVAGYLWAPPSWAGTGWAETGWGARGEGPHRPAGRGAGGAGAAAGAWGGAPAPRAAPAGATPQAFLDRGLPAPASGSGGNGTWIPAGEVLHFTVNRVSSGLRGRSDLAPILPWLRRYREWLEDRARQNRYKGAFLWDVTVQGADKAILDRLRAEYAAGPPAPGSALFHSETEAWRAVQPQVGAVDARDDGRAIRLMVCAGALLPEHYLAEGGNANRATAAEMGLPAIKRFQRRQEYFRALLAALVDRVLDEAQRVGRLGPRANRSFSVQFEELTVAPVEKVSAAVAALTGALAQATEMGWVSDAEARRLWWRFAGQADESAPLPAPDG